MGYEDLGRTRNPYATRALHWRSKNICQNSLVYPIKMNPFRTETPFSLKIHHRKLVYLSAYLPSKNPPCRELFGGSDSLCRQAMIMATFSPRHAHPRACLVSTLLCTSLPQLHDILFSSHITIKGFVLFCYYIHCIGKYYPSFILT